MVNVITWEETPGTTWDPEISRMVGQTSNFSYCIQVSPEHTSVHNLLLTGVMKSRG